MSGQSVISVSNFQNSVRTIGLTGLLVATGFAGGRSAVEAADAPPAKVIFQFRPLQKDVEFESPSADDQAKCKVDVERKANMSGWVVYGPQGQILRRFVDTDGDNQVDQWRYFNHGIEVYRDIDTNKNNKADQFRWVNLGGSRWGIDTNEDGKIDQWRVLSAAEASREAVEALVARDEERLAALMISAKDIQTLGMPSDLGQKLLEGSTKLSSSMREILSKSKVITPRAKWMKFDASNPSRIPSDEGKAENDLDVYENAMAIIETGPNQSALVQIGEMIRVGDVWKITQVPQPLEGDSIAITAGGVLMQPLLNDPGSPEGISAPSPEMQEFVQQLQKLDQTQPAPTAPPAAFVDYNTKRADILKKLVSLSKDERDRGQWMRQLVDGIAASVQTGGYPDGLQQLKTIEESLAQNSPKSEVLPYVIFRRIQSDYAVAMQKENDLEKRQDLQKTWLDGLEGFLKDYPTSEDAPEAMLQLAVTEEFNGRSQQSQEWYGKLAKQFPGEVPGRRAQGALKRLDLKGQPFQLSGTLTTGGEFDLNRYKGRAVLVLYWATWCEPCKEDLPIIRALLQQYQSKGFEVVGVCLDGTPEPVQPFIQANKIPWPQIYMPGGFQSEPAMQYGIISLPTMFLVGKDGRVASRNTSVQELKVLLPQILAK